MSLRLPCAADEPFTRWVPMHCPLDPDDGPRTLAWDGAVLLLFGPHGLRRLGPPWEAGCGSQGPQGAHPLLRHGALAALPERRGEGFWCALPPGLAYWDRQHWWLLADTFGRGWGSPLALALDPEGEALWLGCSSGHLARRSAIGRPAADGEAEVPLVKVTRLPAAVRALGPTPFGILAATDAGLYLVPSDGAGPCRLLSEEPARDLLRDGPGWLVATARGLRRVVTGVWGAEVSWEAPAPTLPCRDLWHLGRTGDGTLWAGGPRGLLRRDPAGWHLHQGPHWLAADAVRALVAGPDGVCALTARGLSVLRPQPCTLAAKVQAVQERVEARHRRLGLYVEETALAEPGVGESGVPTVSDNDGLWTGMYLAAQCYRYAATADPQARRLADRSFAALERLEAITTIPGYPTKAIVPAAERPHGGTWYPSADGQWLWKGDCSSDEIVGHFYACSLYHDLVADGEGRARVAAHLRRILEHILGNGLRLMEFGQRTRWGYWDPETLGGVEGRWGDRGLNALEILSHLCVAEHVTGDTLYRRAQEELIERHGYLAYAAHTKVDMVGHVNHSDDELAFLAYDPLLRYERDPERRGVYLVSLARAWAHERPERNPLWNFIFVAHAAPSSPAAELEAALQDALRTLRELPLDTIAWPVQNSWRDDVDLDPLPDRHGAVQANRVLPYDELPITRWNGNPYQCDGGNAREEGDGVLLLLPYWMGRAHGWIAPPAGNG